MANIIEICMTNEFKEAFASYGYEEFIKKAWMKCANKKEHGLTGKITLIDAEPNKRIYFINEQGKEFWLRYFISFADEKKWKASYTFYTDENNSSVIISEGIAIVHYIYTKEELKELEERKKIKRIAPVVIDAKVTDKSSCMCNVSYVDFKLKNEKETFTIKFFEEHPKCGCIYGHLELYKYMKDMHEEAEIDISKQVLEILKLKNETLYDDRPREEIIKSAQKSLKTQEVI